MLRLESISKSYMRGQTSIETLKNIDLSIGRGEFCAIVGPSGSGKSTLLNIIGLMDRASSGRIELHGRDVARMNASDMAHFRNQHIGFVFQSFQLLPRMKAWENVALPLMYRGMGSSARRARACEALERVGLQDRLDHKPMELSGGQQQRVALARALVNEPSLILADEPTGSLDSESSAAVIDLLEELNEGAGVAIVTVTHDQSVAARCMRQIRILDGQLAT